MLKSSEKEFLIRLINEGIDLPEDFKSKLFPINHKEYELSYAGKMRREDLLADDDGSFAVPLQIDRVFNGTEHEGYADGWRNMIVFGDNLQFLKTIYKSDDPILKDNIKGKIKLIYIDPPFATQDDFQNKEGAKAYSDKKKGAEFIEFLRRRLIVAREILADDGMIYVHLDWKKAHYIKIVMDEIFGENNFLNDIIWYYRRWNIASKMFARNHDIILCYVKNKSQYSFNNLYIPKSEKSSGQGKAWQSYIDEETGKRKSVLLDSESKGVPMPDVWDISMVNPVALERKQVGYPTQKPELLLQRIIEASTNPGDIVLDFFAGSGTTAAVAEKLGRKWIVCDIGKLSFYTIQKRILQIRSTNSLTNQSKKYNTNARSFVTCKLGNYDLKQTLELEWDKYLRFVSSLFNIDMIKTNVSGLEFEGRKDDHLVKVFDYNKFKESKIDEQYLENLHAQIGRRTSTGRIYIVAPYYKFSFIQDYYEIDGTKYFFLKIPYQMINELHVKPFQKFRQPKSKNDVNSMDESVGFSFNRNPEIVASLQEVDEDVIIKIESFKSKELATEKSSDEKVMEDFELLSALFIDKKYNGTDFIMTDSIFYEDLEKNGTSLIVKLKKKEVGSLLMVVFTDIYGNDFTQIFKV